MHPDLGQCLPSVAIDVLALVFIALAVRAVALEILPLAILCVLVMLVASIGHAVTFLFRHPGLNTANLLFDLLLTLCLLLFCVLLCRFRRRKPSHCEEPLTRATSGETEALSEAPSPREPEVSAREAPLRETLASAPTARQTSSVRETVASVRDSAVPVRQVREVYTSREAVVSGSSGRPMGFSVNTTSVTGPLSDLQSEIGDLRSYADRRLTEISGIEICCEGLDSGKAPIANFSLQ